MTTGRIIERKNGYGYVISAGRDPVTGKYKQIWRTGFKSQKEAREKLRQHLNELDDEAPSSDMLLSDWLERWIKEDCSDMKPTTIKSYRSCVNQHLIPAIGKIRLDKLSHNDIQRMYARLEKKLSSVTVHKVHRCLRAALNKAIKRGYLKESPMTRVDSPERRSPKRSTLGVRQALEMLEWLKSEGYVAYYGAFLAVHGGLRLGEVCGLQWRDVNWESNTIYVRRTRQRHYRQDILIEPKTADSVRDIVLSDAAMQEIRRWYMRQRSIGLQIGKTRLDESYVVVLDDLIPPEPHAFAKGVKAALTDLELPLVTFHDLRHTHATWLLESGVDLKTVSQRLGHSSITITADVYSHVTKRMQQDAVSKLESMLNAEKRRKENL